MRQFMYVNDNCTVYYLLAYMYMYMHMYLHGFVCIVLSGLPFFPSHLT